ncbi:hypothetical protein DL95DRAFT_408504 [Leptodontidium sp. 2 PMI_412]|nr:hypothetical protein DL95DRAFT_408504 [Leptodontidium sp. 2 PMI_412]
MVKIQELIKMGKMRGTVSCKTLDDCPADSVTKVQSQIRTLHSQNGNILRYTVLTITLDGSELLEKNDHVTQAPAQHSIPGDADVAIQSQGQGQAGKLSSSPSVDGEGNIPEDAACKELEELKRKIEIKANERLQKQLDYVEKVHKNHLDTARRNYNKILDDSLHAIQFQKNNIAQGHTVVRLPEKFAAEIARSDSKLWKEYQNLCTESLEVFQADLKRQYRERLGDIETECREWLQTYAGSNLNVGAIDGITGAIIRAHRFKARIPDITETSQTKFTQEEIEAAKDEQNGYFWDQARKDIQDGGMAFRRENVQLDPLFDDDEEPTAGRSPSTVEVPAALLSLYQGNSNTSASQASAALNMMDWNNSSHHVQSTPSSSQRNGFQAQGLAPQHSSTRNFTPINRPYVSPYVAKPAQRTSQFGPVLVPGSTWYGPSDRRLADRTRACSVGYNAFPRTQSSAAGYGASYQTGGDSFEQKTGIPLAGTFTISQPQPRRVAPTLVGPTAQVYQSLEEEDGIPYVPRLASPISKSNIISAPRRKASGLLHPNTHVDNSLYDEDSEERDEDYVPPPASPYQRHSQTTQQMRNKSACQELPRIDLNSYVDESLYDEDYVPPSASTTPQQYQHLKTEQSQQTRRNLLSIPSHPVTTPPSPWINDALRRPFEDGSGDLPDYEPSDSSDLPDYQDVGARAADTSTYISGTTVERGRDVISISSDDEEDRNGNAGGGGTGRENDDPYAPISNYYAPEPEFGHGGGYQTGLGQGRGDIDGPYSTGIDRRSSKPHVDPYASMRGPRPLPPQDQDQNQRQDRIQTQIPNPLRGDAAFPAVEPEYEPSSSIIRNDTTKKVAVSDREKAGFRRVTKNKTVRQVMQMLKAEEEKKKRKRGEDRDEDANGGEKAAKRVWNGESMDL